MGWYVDPGLATLIRQWKRLNPGAVVGTIGDLAHQVEYSEHNPEADGSVDAGDFMEGNGVTFAELAELARILSRNHDKRLFYVIWEQSIFSDPNGNGQWAWRYYNGEYHDHVHVSVNDNYEHDDSEWNLGNEDDVALSKDMIAVTTTTGKELFEPDKEAGSEVSAATLLQLSAIWAKRSADNGTRILAQLEAMNNNLSQIVTLLKAKK